jgi:hypothetical protein
LPYKTWATNDVPSAADFNNLFSDPVQATVDTSEVTSSTTYANLATTTDSVTLSLVNGQIVLIEVSVYSSSASTLDGFASYEVTGASGTILAADTNAARLDNTDHNWKQATKSSVFTATATGSHTFKMKYRNSSASNATYANRRIIARKY